MKVRFLLFLALRCNSLKLIKLPEENKFDQKLDEITNFEASLDKPLSQEDLEINDKSGLRPALEEKLKVWSSINGKKPVLYFIGDSYMRNMGAAACSIVQRNQTLNERFPAKDLKKLPDLKKNFKKFTIPCEGELGDVFLAWSPLFSPDQVSELAGKYGKAPDFIFFDGSIHYVTKTLLTPEPMSSVYKKYRKQAAETMHAYARYDPNVKIKFWLAHKMCHQTRKNFGNSEINTFNAISLQEAKFEPRIKVVDGYTFTENLGCDETADGLHYDRHLYEAIMKLLDA